MEGDRIGETFNGRTILITGGTGFLGKIIVEKLLRCVDDVDQLYLLVRSKKERSATDRLADIFSNYLFDKVKQQRSLDYLLKKTRIIAGDAKQPNLGISPADRQLIIENVSIMYHCAASIRFDEPLKDAVLLNTRGTKYMLDLAKECKKLDMFAYISTAYSQWTEKVLYEKAYPPSSNPYQVIKVMEWLDDEEIKLLASKILGTAPNTYAFTKALAESLCVDAMAELPIVIYRPSIVVPTWLEPVPGWTDNINGPVGILIAAGKGVLRTMYCKADNYGDFLPVDIAANALCVATWNYLVNKDVSRKFYHFTSSSEIKTTWGQIIEDGHKLTTTQVPLNGVMWYPGGSMKSTRLGQNIAAFFFHWVPAYFLDFLIVLFGYPPVLVRVQRRIQKGFEVLEYYANNQWDFDTTNIESLRLKMNALESVKYKIDSKGFVHEEYFLSALRAARVHILKEMDDTLPAAKRHMRIMYWVDRICKGTIIFLFVYFIGGFLYRLLFSS